MLMSVNFVLILVCAALFYGESFVKTLSTRRAMLFSCMVIGLIMSILNIVNMIHVAR